MCKKQRGEWLPSAALGYSLLKSVLVVTEQVMQMHLLHAHGNYRIC